MDIKVVHGHTKCNKRLPVSKVIADPVGELVNASPYPITAATRSIAIPMP